MQRANFELGRFYGFKGEIKKETKEEGQLAFQLQMFIH